MEHPIASRAAALDPAAGVAVLDPAASTNGGVPSAPRALKGEQILARDTLSAAAPVVARLDLAA